MPIKPPVLRFVGGPLDGNTRERPERGGRRPRYRDETGVVVPTFRMSKYRVAGCDCLAFRLYELTETGPKESVYRWRDQHTHP